MRWVRDGLSYWRDIETGLRFLGVVGLLIGAIALVVSQLQVLPPWVGAAITFLAGLGLGIVIGLALSHAVRTPPTPLSPAPEAPIQAEHNEQRYRVHDDVMWFLAAWYRGGGVKVDGPLCPVHKSPLGYVRVTADGRVREVNNNDMVDQRHGMLVCATDGQQYLLGNRPRVVNESRSAVARIFEGDLREGLIRWP